MLDQVEDDPLDPTTLGVQLADWAVTDWTTRDESADFALLYDSSRPTSRTFLDANGNPELSVSINRDGDISGISRFEVDLETGDILWIDSFRMLDQDTGVDGVQLADWAVTDWTTRDESADFALLYDSSRPTSRTFLDANGNPELSVSINRDGDISGISRFEVDLETGDILWIDSFRMLDQVEDDPLDPTTLGVQLADWAVTDWTTRDESADFALLYDSSRPTSRTFLDANGNPELSVSINRVGDISGISRFEVDLETGDILWIDSFRMLDQDTGVDSVQLADWAVTDWTTREESADFALLYDSSRPTSRTFLDANGNPELSVSINRDRDISGIS